MDGWMDGWIDDPLIYPSMIIHVYTCTHRHYSVQASHCEFMLRSFLGRIIPYCDSRSDKGTCII